MPAIVAIGFGAVILVFAGGAVFGLVFLDHAAFDGGDFVLLGRVDLLDAFVAREIVGQRTDAVATIKIVILVDAVFFVGAQARFFFRGRGFFGQQRFAIFPRNLIIVGMDFAESEEPVAVAAEIDEGRLKRRFDPCNLG